jgi:hypothetical protein
MPSERKPGESGRVRPFSTASERCYWHDENCVSCAKQPKDWHHRSEDDCPIFDALSEGGIGDGMISAEIAERMGCTVSHAYGECPRCKEHLALPKGEE